MILALRKLSKQYPLEDFVNKMKRSVTFQIGKNGFKESFIQTLESAFIERENIKVIVLKSAGHTREKIQEIADKIVEKLGKKYTYKILGFTIFLKKWRKERR